MSTQHIARNVFSRIQHSAFNIQRFFLVLLLAGPLIFSHCVSVALDHDEHQFVASAALLERRGLLPYRDYPYLHTPYLVFADAALFRLAGPSAKLLLTARLFSAACSFATVTLLAAAVAALYRDAGPRRSATALAALLLLTNPMFTAVTGLAWNHDAAELLLLGAAILFLQDICRGAYGSASMLAAGSLLGLSIGVRLTVAPAAAAFVGMALADPRVPWRRRFIASGFLLLGSAIALSPCAWLFLQAPRGFIFGNFQYPTLNTAYRLARGSMSSSTTPIGKTVYFLSRVIFSSGTGFFALLSGWTIWLGREKKTRNVKMPRRGEGPLAQPSEETHRRVQGGVLAPSVAFTGARGRQEMKFLGLLILFLLVGSFAPAPMFIVYFYAPIPFAVLWLAYAWRPLLVDREEGFNWQMKAAAALALACIACGAPAWRNLTVVLRPRSWIPLHAHDSGVNLRRQLAAARAVPGPVLTLAPIIPLEGGLDVYEQYATGPFALRVASMLPEQDRRALHLTDERDLKQLLNDRPPSAVLFNVEGRDEEAPMLRAIPGNCPTVRPTRGSKFQFVRPETSVVTATGPTPLALSTKAIRKKAPRPPRSQERQEGAD